MTLMFIWFPLQIIAILNHLGGQYYIYDIFTDSTIYDEYYQNIQVDYENQQDANNLITIYIEQMENTYQDVESGGYFDINYIPNLTKLSEENITFSNSEKPLGGAVNTTGCDLTSGGLIGTSVGMPLNWMEMAWAHTYSVYTGLFNGLNQIGDILNNLGYYSEFVCGTDIAFGGREDYFKTHQYDSILGLYELENEYELSIDYINNFSGINDHQLLDICKQELQKIANENERFNFTILTLDTHYPGDYRCEYCENQYGDSYGDVLSCVDKQIYDFVEWCKQQDWYENTTIVITGDHTFMTTNDLLEQLDEQYTRTIYNCFINSKFDKTYLNESGRTTNRHFTQLDMFPTILQSIGIDCSDFGGIGTSLVQDNDTIIEQRGFEWYETQANLQSDLYKSLINSQIRQ